MELAGKGGVGRRAEEVEEAVERVHGANGPMALLFDEFATSVFDN